MNLWLDAFVPAFALLGLGALLRRVLLRDCCDCWLLPAG
jgi:hypothetical protein